MTVNKDFITQWALVALAGSAAPLDLAVMVDTVAPAATVAVGDLAEPFR